MWSGKVEFHAQILQRLTSLESKLGEVLLQLVDDALHYSTIRTADLQIIHIHYNRALQSSLVEHTLIVRITAESHRAQHLRQQFIEAPSRLDAAVESLDQQHRELVVRAQEGRPLRHHLDDLVS